MEAPLEIVLRVFGNYKLEKEIIEIKSLRRVAWTYKTEVLNYYAYAGTWPLKVLRLLSKLYHQHVPFQYMVDNCDVDVCRGPMGKIALSNHYLTKSLWDEYLPNVFPTTDRTVADIFKNKFAQNLAIKLGLKFRYGKYYSMGQLMEDPYMDTLLNYTDYKHAVAMICYRSKRYLGNMNQRAYELDIYNEQELLRRPSISRMPTVPMYSDLFSNVILHMDFPILRVDTDAAMVIERASAPAPQPLDEKAEKKLIIRKQLKVKAKEAKHRRNAAPRRPKQQNQAQGKHKKRYR
nr:hypothetical protein K-LCC10_0466 [Kaumoebavirus]